MLTEKRIPLTDTKEKAKAVADIIARHLGPVLAKQPKPEQTKGA